MPYRIAITTSYGHWGEFSPQDMWEPGGTAMIGGGETAMFSHARYLAELGHDVTLFYNVKRPGTHYGIKFLPVSMKLPMLTMADWDMLISWEDEESISINHRAKLVIYSAQCNSMHIGIRNIAIDGYQMVSKSHVEHMHTYDQTADPSKFFIVPNGVDLARYANPPERQPYRVIHSSSPDRGLHHLLRIWPKIKKAVPQAELHIYYEINRWLDLIESLDKEKRTTITTIRAGEVRDGLKATEGMDVTCHGAVNQWDLAQEQMKSSLMIYPCDPVAYTEGFSISCLESMAAGTPVITSDADALPELWGDCTTMLPLPVEDADWIDASVRLLTKKKPWLAASRLGREVAANYQWKDITRDYAEILDRKFYAKVLKEKLTPISPMEFMVSAMGR